MRNPSIVARIVSEITAFIRTDGHGWIDSASDPDQEYIYVMGSETLPFTCYILSDKSIIPFYSTSNWYNKKDRYSLCHRLLDTRYSAKCTAREIGINK